MIHHQIRAVLFDLDGVVVFTDKYHYLGWKKLADDMGWEFDEEINHQLRGIPRIASLEVMLRHNNVELPMEEKERLANQKNEYYKELLKNISADDLYPGIIDFLESLKSSGVEMGLCSSSKNAQTVLDALDLSKYFGAVVTGNDIVNAKPDPEIFLKGAKGLGIPPFHCVVFEDAESGVEAALAAGMKCIGVGKPELLPSAAETITDYADIDIEAMLDSGRTRMPPEEPWALTETAVRPRRAQYWESLFALSNGYLGLRGAHEEEDVDLMEHAYPGMFINGVYDYKPYHYEWKFPGYPEHGHAMVNLCDWRMIELRADDEVFSPLSRGVEKYERRLDLEKGVLSRTSQWRTESGALLEMRSERLVSMRREHSAAIRYTVEVLEGEAEIKIESRVRPAAESQVLPGQNTKVKDACSDNGAHVYTVETVTAPFTVAMAFTHRLSGADFQHEANCVPENSSDTFCFTLKSGEKAALEKHASFYTNIETEGSKLASSAKTEVLENARDGFETLMSEQSDFWAEHWKYGDVQIEGNASDQQAMRLSLFHLRQGTPTDGYRSVGANSLTGDKYCGHVFWDTEMYVEPCLAYLDPSLVKPLLMYRYNILDKARERAIQMEGKGALYSWNSISGEECGVVFEAATAEYHLESAIAWAVKRYVDQSGDQDFLYEYGAEMLFETARFLEDRGAYVPWKKQQFCLNAVCGPDEYGCAVNNNCYTNMMTQWHLEYAANIHAEMEEKSPELLAELKKKIGLEQSEVEAWREAARRMYVPYNEALGIHEQDDSFLSLDPVDMSKVPLNKDIREEHHPLNLWRMQVAKQADVVLLMFVRGELFDLETKRRNYDFYEARTCHGSSLSACIHSIVAAEVGLADHAYAYFHQSARMDMCDFKDNTSAGVHTACLGGTWMALVQGFAGMRDYSDGLHLAPRLPNEWKGYAFHLMYRANRIKISVDKDGCTCRLVDGEGLDIHTDASVNRLDRDNSEIKCDLLPWTDT